jgi:hypothetical protein
MEIPVKGVLKWLITALRLQAKTPARKVVSKESNDGGARTRYATV